MSLPLNYCVIKLYIYQIKQALAISGLYMNPPTFQLGTKACDLAADTWHAGIGYTDMREQIIFSIFIMLLEYWKTKSTLGICY